MKRLLLAALLVAAPLAAQIPGQDAATVEATAKRMTMIPMATSVESVDAYQPSETVKGRETALKAARKPSIPKAALDAAETYAASMDSFAFIVLRDGRIERETYWNGMGPASRFSTASMNKTLMALAFGAAVDSGKMSADAPIATYYPELANDPRGAIRMRQLLQMASGLEDPPTTPAPTALRTQLMFAPDITAAALRFRLTGTPGKEFVYGNVNSQLAGAAIGRATGMRYADWLSSRIWRHIGAADAALWLDRPGGEPHHFCCIGASARDWAKVGELIRNKGEARGFQVVSANWIAQMTTASPANPNYGLQVWLGSPHAPLRKYSAASPLAIPAKAPFARDDVIFLDGAGAQRVYIVPSERLTIVRIGKPTTKWDDSAMPNMILEALK
jgi:CubicO group peptidase (beta-lactamase class C family)